MDEGGLPTVVGCRPSYVNAQWRPSVGQGCDRTAGPGDLTNFE